MVNSNRTYVGGSRKPQFDIEGLETTAGIYSEALIVSLKAEGLGHWLLRLKARGIIDNHVHKTWCIIGL